MSRDIVPRQSPTTPSTARFSYSEASSDENDDYLDEKRSFSHVNSEAARYLAQFQSDEPTPLVKTPRRPAYHRAHASMSAAPSLSHTPTSTVSTSIPYTPNHHRPLGPRSNPYFSYSCARSVDLVTPLTTTNARDPLTAPSSFHPSAAYSFKAKPSIAPPSLGIAEAELHTFERASISSTTPSQRSLLNFHAMQAAPKGAPAAAPMTSSARLETSKGNGKSSKSSKSGKNSSRAPKNVA